MEYYLIHLTINGTKYTFSVTEEETLLDVIREKAGLTGTKQGCGCSQCGAVQADGAQIQTIESLASSEKLHPIQEAYIEAGAIQCGFCTPGMIMSTKALLDRNPCPSRPEIREALSGNLCRCTGYTKIEQAVQTAALKLKEVSHES